MAKDYIITKRKELIMAGSYNEYYSDYDDDYEYDDYDYDYDDLEDDDSRSEFADPGGNSALRAESPTNPRNLPCPTCGTENVLTPKDRALGYQCDRCADRDEGGY